ncbi:MAG: ribosomal protein S18-alanine N-acetyltransferase [Oscillospiraceae bacterium]|nr:ribosomal protein S18-alanine N-acetyltransferase [Oscillospiraceae bacterium]
MEFTIRDVAPEHIPQLENLERQCFSRPWTAEQLRSQLKDSQHESIAAIASDGEVLGYVGMMYVLDEGYISNVAVSPAYRRQGIGDALITHLCAICEALGLSFVTLEVRAGNAPAIALYEKHGFQRVGLRKNYYEHLHEDAILMTKFFELTAKP